MSAQGFLSNKLFQAVEIGELSNLSKIISESNIDVTQYFDITSSSLLIKAIFVNQTEISLFLLDVAKNNTNNELFLTWIESKNDIGFNALHYASVRLCKL
jgi:hypothetical protein